MTEEQREHATVLINSLLDRIKAEQHITTETALARYLGTTQMSLIRWRKGEVAPSTIKLLPHAMTVYTSALESA